MSIVSKPASPEYRDHWADTFGGKKLPWYKRLAARIAAWWPWWQR